MTPAPGFEEKTFALATGVTALAIVASLLFGGWLSDLVSSGAAGMGFSIAFFLSLAAFAGLIWKRGRRSSQIWVSAGLLAIVLIAATRLGMSQHERGHLFEYGAFAAFLYLTLEQRTGRVGSPNRPALLAWIVALGFGGLDEGLQLFIPDRVFDARDLLFNVLAASFTVAVLKLTSRRAIRT